jgi:hypothetical protein
MTIKVWNAMKSMGILSLLLLLVFSCSDDDLNSIDAGFIDNLNFVTTELISEVQFSNEDISRVQSSQNGQFLLGVYDEDEISKIRGSFVSQLLLPSDINYYSSIIYEDTLVTSLIDDVVLYVPYHATVLSENEGAYTYKLDSVFGIKNTDVSVENNEPFGDFDFKVYDLKTFLNPLDPTDPSSANTYYTDKEYEVNSELANEEGFVLTASDTETLIERYVGGQKYDEEIIKLSNNAPRMAIHLNKDFFQSQILDKLPAEGEATPPNFQSQESFVRYFKGLFVNATSTAPASIATLPLNNAFVEMYYTNEVSLKSTGETLDTIAKTMKFSLGGVKACKYETLNIAPKNNDKLYIQGTSGAQANVKLFGYDDANPNTVSEELKKIRELANDEDGNLLWLINEASLLFYVDSIFEPTETVYKLFLYKKVPEISSIPSYNSQLLDYITAPDLATFDGDFVQGLDGSYYKFKLTDYITELLSGKNNKNVDNLALKLYNQGDYPNATTDTVVDMRSWNPRGVVLSGHNVANDSDRKRVKLQINYSFQNR